MPSVAGTFSVDPLSRDGRVCFALRVLVLCTSATLDLYLRELSTPSSHLVSFHSQLPKDDYFCLLLDRPSNPQQLHDLHALQPSQSQSTRRSRSRSKLPRHSAFHRTPRIPYRDRSGHPLASASTTSPIGRLPRLPISSPICYNVGKPDIARPAAFRSETSCDRLDFFGFTIPKDVFADLTGPLLAPPERVTSLPVSQLFDLLHLRSLALTSFYIHHSIC